ncbi:hypothetical protein [Nocardia sp. NPDC050710]|uniref:hypothetical protein n=1 Tax=Nocardia sp. NPDC050710 TaxID=3157220 RepID=UPI0034112817
MHRIAGWWDGFELWVAGLPFIPQFLVVLVGMVPISFAIAVALDRALRTIMQLLGRDRAEAAAIAAAERAMLAPAVETREPAQSGAR